MSRISKAVQELGSAVRHVELVFANGGDRARRNARQRVLSALLKVRRVLNEDYRVARRALRVGRKKTERQLTAVTFNHALASRAAKAGVKLHFMHAETFVPSWVVELRDCSVAQLRAARRSVKQRKKLLALTRISGVAP